MILSEAEIISRVARLKSSKKNAIFGDDIGAFRTKSITYAGSDSVIENTHYRAGWVTPRDIAYKLFARNWSDFLVKGIKPAFAVMNLGLSRKSARSDFLNPFLAGLDRLFTQHSITLIGGDTARSANDVFTLTFLGTEGNFIPRKGSSIHVGDLIVQLGPVGGADWARQLLQRNKECPARVKRFFTQQQILSKLPGSRYLKATIDQSDSVAKSLAILAQSNAATLTIAVEQIKVSLPAIRKTAEILNAAEDLAVFAIADKTLLKSTRAFQPIGYIDSIRVKHPGVVYRLRGKTVSYTAHGSTKLTASAYEHFK